MDYQLVKAQLSDLEQIAVLFDKYRQFYEQGEDISLSEYFIKSRLIEKNSMIFVAKDMSNTICGFCQAFPSFSSILAKRTLILNDLFVSRKHRRKGVASALVTKIISVAVIEGVDKIDLQTHPENIIARNLYERLGFKLDDEYLSYERLM